MEIAEIKDALEEQMKKSHPRYQLAIDCLQDEPKLRPSTAELNKTLNQLGTKHPKSPEDVASILQEVCSYVVYASLVSPILWRSIWQQLRS